MPTDDQPRGSFPEGPPAIPSLSEPIVPDGPIPATPADIEKLAVEAARQGGPDAKNTLGSMYAQGRGVEQDDAKAVKWYRLAAEQGEPLGQVNLGMMHIQGRGVEQDDVEAVRLFRLAAEQGDSDGQLYLGLSYGTGRGVAQDDVEAVRLYRLAAEQGHPSGRYFLGRMYAAGRGVAQDDVEAVRLFRLAAEQGQPLAQANLGFHYLQGEGVAKDDEEALRLFRLAVEQGEPLGQVSLGFIYAQGGVVAQDDVEAVRLYRLAAEQGEPAGQYFLGTMYLEGRGVPQDRAIAVKWFRLAAEQGDPLSAGELEKLEQIQENNVKQNNGNTRVQAEERPEPLSRIKEDDIRAALKQLSLGDDAIEAAVSAAMQAEFEDRSKSKSPDSIGPVFEGTLDREAMAEALRCVRKKAGLSQRATAEQAGTSQTDIKRIEQGEATVEKASEVLAQLGYQARMHLVPVDPA